MKINLNREIDFVNAVFNYIEGGEILRPVEILHNAEIRHGLLFANADPILREEFWDEEWIKNVLFPFFDETNFIIAAGDFLNNVEIFNSQFQITECSWRVWGGFLADWLNSKIDNKNLEQFKWNYINFYMEFYIKDFFDIDYASWAKAIQDILAEKDRIYADKIKKQAELKGKKLEFWWIDYENKSKNKNR